MFFALLMAMLLTVSNLIVAQQQRPATGSSFNGYSGE